MRDPGSFRDPSGYVFRRDGRIFRALSDEAYRNFLLMRSSGAYGALRGRGWLISAEEVELDDAAHRGLRMSNTRSFRSCPTRTNGRSHC
jgi:hypothetical protein